MESQRRHATKGSVMNSIRDLARGRPGLAAPLRRPLTAVLLAIGLMVALSASAVARTAASASSKPAYLNAGLPVQARVGDLLGRMTLPEKIGQMVQIEQSQVTDKTSACTSQSGFNLPNPACEQKIFVDDHAGSILAGGTDIPTDTTGKGGPGNTGLDWATEYNTMQNYAIQHSRLHIPVIFGVDAVHGFGHPYQAPLFPQSIGMGATWDPSAAEAGGAGHRERAARHGLELGLRPGAGPGPGQPVGPQLRDLGRGAGPAPPPWVPRTCAACRAAARTALKVTATVKHFAGYSQSINGHDRVQAELPIRYLQDTFLPSYAGAINAGAGTVMVDSGSVNGIPATASHYLLTTQLRGRLGFKGVVISDYGDVPALATTYHIASDLAGAAASADQRRRRHGHAAVQRRRLADRSSAGRAPTTVCPVSRINQAVTADPHAEVPARALRPPVGRRQQGERRRASRAGTSRCRRPASRSPCCATRTTCCRSRPQQAGRHRTERGLDDEPARRLERQLAGRLRRRPRLLHGAALTRSRRAPPCSRGCRPRTRT